MKICLINNLYGRFARGGAETAVNGYAKLLESAGYEIFIITTLPRGESASAGDDKIYYLGGLSSFYYHLGRLPLFFRLIWQLGNLLNFANYFRIKKILSGLRPDLVMTHNLMGVGFLTPLAAKRLKIRHLHFLHDIQLLHPSGLMLYGKEKIIRSFPAKIYQAATRRLFGSPEKIISPSGWLLREHLDQGYFTASKKIILPNPAVGPDLMTHNPPPESGNHKFRFLYVGQLEDHKGALFLAETFSRISPDAAELLIVGSGSQFEALEKISGTSKNIKLLGRISREEALDQMSRADCLVVPSLCYENAPSVIAEAIACGLPVIASRIGGIPELLGNRAELMFTPGDTQELAARLDWAVKQHSQSVEIISALRQKLPVEPTAQYLKKIL